MPEPSDLTKNVTPTASLRIKTARKMSTTLDQAQSPTLRYLSDTEESDHENAQTQTEDALSGPEGYDSDGEIEAPLEAQATLQNEKIMKTGYLLKKGEKRKVRRNWKKRWFVLRSTKLACYKDEKEYELLRIIEINEIHRVAEVKLKNKQNVFAIVTPRRTYYLQAANRSEMLDWMNAVDSVKDVLETDEEASQADTEDKTPQPSRRRFSLITPRRSFHIPTGELPTQISSPMSPVTPSTPIFNKQRTLPTPIIPGSAPAASSPISASPTRVTAIDIPLPNSPPNNDYFANVPNSYSSNYSYATTNTLPATPSSPLSPSAGGFFSRDEATGSSEEEDILNDPVMAAAGIAAMAANAPGSGILSAEETDNRVILQGYMLKLGNKYKAWRKRWFVLRNGSLTYYKNEKEYVPHGIIHLSNVLDCLQTDPVSKSKKYCLKIVTPKRSYTCCVEKEDDFFKWLDAINVALNRAKKAEDIEGH